MSLEHRLHARCAGLALGAPPFALSGTERQYERSRPFLVRHLMLDLELHFQKKSVSGAATLDFERVAPDATELVLDAVGFTIERVRIDTGDGWSDARFEYDGDQIRTTIPLRATLGKLLVVYEATPQRGMYFLSPDKKVKQRPVQVWTQCQDEDARHWFPCHDKPHVKMTTELRVDVPEGFTVLSNGELVSSERPAGKKWVWHFKLAEPHPSYLVTMVAGRFEQIEDRPAERADGRMVPVVYYVPEGRTADARRSFGETPRMIELFGRLTGVPYPWARYSQVVVSDFIFGGMENTTATTMYEHILLDERAAIDVSSCDLVAHELAHQWFGDYVTCRDWSHAWLNEGFATFFEHVEREDRLGHDEYEWGVRADLDAYLSEASSRYARPIVCRDYKQPIDLFDRHLYEKGGLVLHMLRRELGDELFWRGIRLYLERHAYSIVETNDLARALEEVSGRSLERFFDQWVYRPGHPELKLKISWEDGLLSVSAKQSQKAGETAIFSFELEVEIADEAGKLRRHKKKVSSAHDTLVIALAERPAYVAFDPDFRIAAAVTLEAPADFLKKQLESGRTARVRWSAAEALARRDDVPTIRALAKTLANEDEAWMVRSEAARSLGKIRGDEAFRALSEHARTTHPKLRRAVAAALGNFKTDKSLKLLAKLAKKDQSYLVEAEASRALGRTRQKAARELLLDLVDRESWADIARAGALDGLGQLGDEETLEAVMAWTRYGVPSRGRRAAIAALPKISEHKKVRRCLEDLLDDPDPHLRIEVVNALEQLGDARSRGALSRRLAHELDGRVARRIREALRDMGESGARERKRVNDELETLKGELGELKTRLARIEGASKKPNGASESGPSEPEPEPTPEPRREQKAAKQKAAKQKAARQKAAKQKAAKQTAKRVAVSSDRAQRAVRHGAAEKASPAASRARRTKSSTSAKSAKSARSARRKAPAPSPKEPTPRRRKILDERGSR
jgi:aminopeptidase N